MSTLMASVRTIPDTQAALVRSGSHTVVVDRAEGVAGGQGLGFSGGQLLASAIAGCLANDLRYVAADEGLEIESVAVDISLFVDGDRVVDGLTITGADLTVSATAAGDVEVRHVVERALSISAVLRAVRQGFPISVRVG
jgi:uncharacterized OsmC-like protein